MFLSHLASFADRLAEPVLIGIKTKIRAEFHRLFAAFAIVAAGLAFMVAGIAYFASCLWHALEPAMGTVAANLFLGLLYSGVAAALLLGGLRLVR